MALNSKDPRLQKAMLGALGLAGLLYCFFFTTWVPFTYKASASQLKGLEDQYMSMNKDLNKARQATHRLPYLEKEYELLHRKWEQGQSLLPEQVDMTWALRTISLLGAQSGVEFALFKPLAARPAQYHTENPIEITVVGGYHQIGAFLAEMANLQRIINVTDLEIVTNKDSESDKPAQAHFVAVTYTLGGTGVAPQAEKDADEKKGTAGKGGAKKGEEVHGASKKAGDAAPPSHPTSGGSGE